MLYKHEIISDVNLWHEKLKLNNSINSQQLIQESIILNSRKYLIK